LSDCKVKFPSALFEIETRDIYQFHIITSVIILLCTSVEYRTDFVSAPPTLSLPSLIGFSRSVYDVTAAVSGVIRESSSCLPWQQEEREGVITLCQWGLICCRFCLALCRPVQLQRLSAKGRAPTNTAKTADFFFLSNVYNQFLCSLTCTNNQFFSVLCRRSLLTLCIFAGPSTSSCPPRNSCPSCLRR
jgi:hypothetical protein